MWSDFIDDRSQLIERRDYHKMSTKTSDIKTFSEFVAGVKDLLEHSATEKGYNNTGVDGMNEMYQFVQNLSHNDNHAIGEILYKCVRFTNKNDKKDLVKIAAWAYLIWKFGI